jgi:hypothetical protein
MSPALRGAAKLALRCVLLAQALDHFVPFQCRISVVCTNELFE